MIDLQAHIDEIMDELNFDRVQKTLEFLGWEWVGTEEGVPREAELRKQVRSLMEQCHQQSLKYQKDWSTGVGGFNVRYFYEGDFFQVEFRLTHWTTEYLSHSKEIPF